MITLPRERYGAYRRRNDCVEVYPRKLYGLRARVFNYLRKYGPRFQYRYLQWIGAEILWNERTVEYIIASKMLPSLPCRVLDLGSASSRWPIQMASIGYQVTALDVREFGYEHPGVKFVHSSLFNWSPGDLFGCITAISVIEHFGLRHYGDEKIEQGDIEAMRMLSSWLAPDGVIIMSVPYGMRGVTPKHRIYDAATLAQLCIGHAVIEEYYFLRDGEAWLPCEAEELVGVASPSLPVNGAVIRKLKMVK